MDFFLRFISPRFFTHACLFTFSSGSIFSLPLQRINSIQPNFKLPLVLRAKKNPIAQSTNDLTNVNIVVIS